MKQIQYKDFSLKTHKKKWKLKRLNVCQFEITFRCGLHCKHCYADCYNKSEYIKKELKMKDVKSILDKVYEAGVIWICFTGGDPLIREDFLDIYYYAKAKGFIITIFTSAYSMTKEIANYLRKNPPFVIEMTINGVTKDVYEKISQVKDSFDKVIDGLGLILKANLPLKIKTQVTKDNLSQLPMIKKYIEGLGLKFRPDYNLYACLNGDLSPCNLRISPSQLLSLNGRVKTACISEFSKLNEHNDSFFRCAIDSEDEINLDPYGNMFLCNLIRQPAFNLLQVDIGYATNRLLSMAKGNKFAIDSKCNGCNLRELCLWCPGKALLETGDIGKHIEYYCELTQLTKKRFVV